MPRYVDPSESPFGRMARSHDIHDSHDDADIDNEEQYHQLMNDDWVDYDPANPASRLNLRVMASNGRSTMTIPINQLQFSNFTTGDTKTIQDCFQF